MKFDDADSLIYSSVLELPQRTSHGKIIPGKLLHNNIYELTYSTKFNEIFIAVNLQEYKILFKIVEKVSTYEKNNTIHNGCWRSG